MDVDKIRDLLREGKVEEALKEAGGSYPVIHSILEHMEAVEQMGIGKTVKQEDPLEEDLTLEQANELIELQASRWLKYRDPDERYDAMEGSFINEMKGHMETLRRELGAGKAAALPSFRKRTQGTMRRHYYDAYSTGRNKSGGAGLREEDLDKVKGIMQEEYNYLRGFVADLKSRWDEKESIDGLDFRASLYGKSLRKSFNAGILSEAQAGDTVTISAGSVKTEHCEVCPPKWGSYTLEEYDSIGGDPVSWCEGANRCRCFVSVERGTEGAQQE